MRLKVFNENNGTKIEEPVNLKLITSVFSDGINVVAVDDKGVPIPSGNILKILNDGTFELHTSVNERLGFKLDSAGRIKKRGE